MFGRMLCIVSTLALASCATVPIEPGEPTGNAAMQKWAGTCEPWDDWDKPAPPFKIYGNTFYVGTCGIASILVVGEGAYIMLDSGTDAGADVALTNIRSLGFDPRKVEFIGTSHEHFDHIGGMAKLTTATGAYAATSKSAYGVLLLGTDHPLDPQKSMHEPMEPVERVGYWDADMFEATRFDHRMTAIATPGHTPGALTWQWESCEGEECKTIVYADSLSPVSAEGYKFSDHPEYMAEFRKSIAKIRDLHCDILLTPHPSHSRMIERAKSGTFVGGMNCGEYADLKTAALDRRLANEVANE